MKRTLALYILLLANAAVLAHVVVPHHYHHSVLSVAVEAWGGHAEDGHRCTHSEKSSHHGERPEACAVGDAVAAAAVRLLHGDDGNGAAWGCGGHILLFAAAPPRFSLSAPCVPLHGRPHAAPARRAPRASVRATGLRAPPAR